MAQHLRGYLSRAQLLGLACCAALIGILIAIPISAETLTDPTLPPSLSQTQSGILPSGPVLQSVMLGVKRKSAMISGQVIALGEKYGDAVLVRVTDQSAELRNPDGTLQTLLMHPSIEKKVIAQKPESKIIHRTNKRSGAEQAPNSK